MDVQQKLWMPNAFLGRPLVYWEIQPLIDADSAQYAAENNIKERCN